MLRIIAFLIVLTGIAQASFTESKHEFDNKVTIVRRHYKEVGSTQDTIPQFFNEVSRQRWVMVSADSQTGGYGNWGRRWESLKGNVFVSFALQLDPTMGPYVTQIAGVVACDTLQEYGLKPQLRWVNNVLIGDEKIGGVLCKGHVIKGTWILIVGIGINVDMNQETVQKIDQPATSMLLKMGAAPSVEDVLHKLTAHFYRRFTSQASIFKEYFQLLAYIGQEVTVYTGPPEKQRFTNIFEKITPEGHLVLRGVAKPFVTGEIEPKRK
jgi:BirA family biotin operon repressor/biotin-[acetyl-CoA-carboxylase] ligase